MRKITGPIRAAGPIEVKGAEKSPAPSAGAAADRPKASGGLRKLFQPAAIEAATDTGADGEEGLDSSGNGVAKQPTAKAKPGGTPPAKSKPGATPSAKGRPPAARSGASSGGAGGQRGGQQPGRRRNNKRRKRR